ncbi:hypothetical protein AC578_10520 [Pseudocercospora eumusae]|uniref:BZIP domain-containing protein n=1 Tax=Pseudocercospora eumusae TaxID=321146 RepID=A0A139GV56_9PEZI|nr:hypothetical protein AC578_10520 [Pseudocercospora eumusae]
MEGHPCQMMADMNLPYNDLLIAEEQQEHQQVNDDGMPDGSMQLPPYFGVDEAAMQQQFDFVGLGQQPQHQQYDAVMDPHMSVPVGMNMSHQPAPALTQQSYVQSLTPLSQQAATANGWHYEDAQVQAQAAANQMVANGMGQVRIPASMLGPYGSIEQPQLPVAEWTQQAGHHVSASQHNLAAANSRINTAGAIQKVPIQREARRDSRRSSGSPGDQREREGAMTVLASGPMSTAVTVLARPRPGRKPIPHEDAQDRRRVQNRVAQRNFRDKRQQKLQDVTDELAARKVEYEASVSENQRKVDLLTQQNNHLQSQIRASLDQAQAETLRANAAEERVRALEAQVASYQERTRTSIQAGSAAISGSGSIGGFRAISNTHVPKALTETSREADAGPSPPASEEDQPYEIDFTNYGRTTTQGPSNYGLRVTTSNDNNEMDFSFDRSDDKCGFCTDDQNCACKQEKVVERVIEAPIVVRSVTLPGSCDKCRADPVRAQACRDMARSTNMSAQTPVTTPTSETPRTSIFDSRTGLTAMMPPPRMSCSSMVDAFNKFGERTSSIASLFGGKALTAYPAATGGYEFEETQAAEVLSTLSRRSTMAESPQPDDSSRPSLVSTKTS